jgi:hypothetical protein
VNQKELIVGFCPFDMAKLSETMGRVTNRWALRSRSPLWIFDLGEYLVVFKAWIIRLAQYKSFTQPVPSNSSNSCLVERASFYKFWCIIYFLLTTKYDTNRINEQLGDILNVGKILVCVPHLSGEATRSHEFALFR